MLDVTDSGPTLTARALAAFEHRLERRVGRTLPRQYRAFLLTTNGGKPTLPCFFFPSGNGMVDRLFSVGDSRYDRINDLEWNMKAYKGRMPESLLPIGRSPFGDVLCLGVTGRARGKIYYWSHEEEADVSEGEKVDFSNVHLIAASWADFAAALMSLDDAFVVTGKARPAPGRLVWRRPGY